MSMTVMNMYIYRYTGFIMVNIYVKGNLGKDSHWGQTTDVPVHELPTQKSPIRSYGSI